MKFPWYKHKHFEARINSYYDELQDRELMYVETRKLSKIPFKKWQSWKHFSERPFRSFEKCLDELNDVKLFLLHTDVRRKKKNDFEKVVHDWKEIDLE